MAEMVNRNASCEVQQSIAKLPDGAKHKIIVLRSQNRTLPGFEEKLATTTWTSPFFFVQAADTQLGMIVNFGDGTIW